MNIGTKKALGIITCEREKFYEEIIDTTPFQDIDRVYVFDSSPKELKYVKSTDKVTLVETDDRATVGVAKNRLLERMVEDGYEHLFLQEGDVALTDGNVFDAYIDTAKEFGIWGTLNYAWHGDGNFQNGVPVVKNFIQGNTDDVGLTFTQNGTAAFSYIHHNIVRKMGHHDEFYNNCWEHLDFYQKQSVNKLGSYWWWFPDIKDSSRFIRDLDDGSHGGSVIRRTEKWIADMNKGAEHFKKKYGVKPTQMPHATDQQVLDRIDFLVENYSISSGKK